MARGADRRKFRNPDRPIGSARVKTELVDTEDDIDSQFDRLRNILLEVNADAREDYKNFEDLSFLSDSDDENFCEQEEECSAVPPSDAKEKKEEPVVKKQLVKTTAKEPDVKKEPDENVIAEKKSKHGKRDLENIKASQLDDILSKMEIDPERPEKKKKSKSSNEYRDSDSSQSSRKRHHSRSRHNERVVTYSPSSSPSPERYCGYDYNVPVKLERMDQPQHLFGSYHCDVCNITMNSQLTFETHVIGKRHLKNMKMKNLPMAIAQSIPVNAVSEDDSKYPQPEAGVIRKKVNMPAAIQSTVDARIGSGPCPGLELVREIRGLINTTYYCDMCDCTCGSDSIISHLKGFKHHLNSVKHFKPDVYKRIQHDPKYKIEKEVLSILRAVQKKEGMGRLSVEVDELASNPQDLIGTNKSSSSTDYQSLPSTSRGISRQTADLPFSAKFHQASLPNASSSDFFCKICESHMNSVQMWESHVRGKRHLANLKKNPGDLPSKTKTIPVKRRAAILDRIKYECKDEPIVGLKEVRETEIMETQSHSYQCFLCGSCHTTLDIIDHLISLKHRTKYLDHIDFPGREIIAGMSDAVAYSLVKDMCSQVEATEGPGKPAVHVNKNMLYR